MNSNITNLLKKLTLSALCLALGLILPFLTGQIPQIGNALSPMHFPVFLCGLLCGWQYGGLVGAVLPVFRFMLFGMPPLYPTGLTMTFELAAYGITAGLVAALLAKNYLGRIIALVSAMVTGRLVWGAASIFVYNAQDKPFGMSVLITQTVTNAVPGIVLQILIIPLIAVAVDRSGLLRDTQSNPIAGVIRTQLTLYPKSSAVDLLKVLYQNEFGPGHLISDPEKSLKRLREESENSGSEPQNPVEEIGSNLSRLHLSVLHNSDLDIFTFEKFFEISASHPRGETEGFLRKVNFLKKLLRNEKIKISPSEIDAAVTMWKAGGGGLFRHSEAFRNTYKPAYRVVEKQYTDFLEIFQKIDALKKSKERVVVAIDGKCGAGKTTLAAILKSVYDCEIIPLDNFFLQAEQRTAERLAEPGGNVDYERFTEEVLRPLQTGEPFDYRTYDCETGDFGGKITVNPSRLTVIEGSYALRPDFRDFYDLTVFLNVKPDEQLRRIKARNPDIAERFKNEWIPMEERYFEFFEIKSKADSVFFDFSNEK
ncbi:MAG: ECF transporter S component [Ruminococcus sp.]|jgi:uridine kinase/thiamine transporter ThiT|nr:ECF transporter S component [Ruminococcus sp.]